MIRWLEKKGFFHLLSARFLIQFLGFGSVLLVAKFISPTELGEIRIIQSYSNIFFVFAGFGINTAVLKICSENRPYEEKENILGYSLRWSLFFILFTLTVLFLLIHYEILTTSYHLGFWLLIYSAVIPFMVFTDILVVFLQAMKRIKEMANAQIIIKVQSFILVVLSTWKWGFCGFIYATILAFAIGLWPLIHQVGTGFIHRNLTSAPDGFWNLAVFSMLANAMGLIGSYGDVLILDHFCTNRVEIGYYALATIFLLAATQVTGTVQSIVTPYFSEHAHDEKWFSKQLKLNQLRMIFLSIIIALGVFIGGWVLVKFFYGAGYETTINYLAILLIKYIVYSAYAIIGPAILGLGMVQYNFAVVLISTPIGLALAYFMLGNYGIQGVAWAQVMTALLTLLLVQIFSRRAIKKAFGN